MGKCSGRGEKGKRGSENFYYRGDCRESELRADITLISPLSDVRNEYRGNRRNSARGELTFQEAKDRAAVRRRFKRYRATSVERAVAKSPRYLGGPALAGIKNRPKGEETVASRGAGRSGSRDLSRRFFSRVARARAPIESGLILERGYPGGRGGYLGHDQVAINIASRRRSFGEACIERPRARTPRRTAAKWKIDLVRGRPDRKTATAAAEDVLGIFDATRSAPIFAHPASCYLGYVVAGRPCCSTFHATPKNTPISSFTGRTLSVLLPPR